MIRLPLLATIVSETLDGLGIPRKYQAPVIGAPQFAGGFARN
jgi:hypothetical protein